MKHELKTFTLLNIFSIFFGIYLVYFLFNSSFIVPDYYVCTNVIEQSFTFLSNNFNIKYPASCDQNEYFPGFKDFKFIFHKNFLRITYYYHLITTDSEKR